MGNNSIFFMFSMASLSYWPRAIFTLNYETKQDDNAICMIERTKISA